MAKDKTSFILYADQRSYFDKLSDDEAGRLIKHIFSYVNDENPNPVDRIIDLSFEPIKLQLKRDLKKYINVVERNRENGKLGGRPKKQDEPKKPSGLNGNPSKPKKADNDNDNVNDIFIKDIVSPPNGVDPLYFYIAKGYHKMFYDHKGGKTLEQSKLSEWVKIARLLIETDKVEPIHLITIKYYLQSGIDKEKGTDTFWSDTIYSIAALRKKGKDGTYQLDRVKQSAKKWLAKNPDKEPLIYQAYNNLMKKVNGEP